jgi:hypothetical protein
VAGVRDPAPSVLGTPHQLTHLYQVAIGVAKIAADLAAAVDRRGQELRSTGAPLFIDGGDVGDTDVQKARDTIRIRGRL